MPARREWVAQKASTPDCETPRLSGGNGSETAGLSQNARAAGVGARGNIYPGATKLPGTRFPGGIINGRQFRLLVQIRIAAEVRAGLDYLRRLQVFAAIRKPALVEY